MATHTASAEPLNDALITGEQTYKKIDDRIDNIVLQQNKHTLPWYLVFGIGFGLLQLEGLAISWLLYRGVGVWGNQ